MTPHMEALLYGSIYLSICFCIIGLLCLHRANQLTRQMRNNSIDERDLKPGPRIRISQEEE